MNKRGMSHIEVVLAFVLFIGFVGFAIYFLNPIKNPSVGEIFSKNAMNEIIKNSSTEIVNYAIKINSPGIIAVQIQGIPLEYNVVARNYENTQQLNAERVGNIVYTDPESNNFIRLEFSDEFVENGISNKVPTGNYSIASTNSEEFVSERKIAEIKKIYESEDYEYLKQTLNIPKDKEFALQLIFNSTDRLIAERNVSGRIEVFVYEKKVRALKQNGEVKFASLIVKTW